jgi:hypothetical protein
MKFSDSFGVGRGQVEAEEDGGKGSPHVNQRALNSYQAQPAYTSGYVGGERAVRLADRSCASRRLGAVATLIFVMAVLGASGQAQDDSSLPFTVSNPKHLSWSTEEAGRIYMSACELVARSIRPEKPPRLAPKFVLVLGAKENETVHSFTASEVHLREWNPAQFAEAMVLMASREILKNEDVAHLTHDTLIVAEASVSVNELKAKK